MGVRESGRAFQPVPDFPKVLCEEGLGDGRAVDADTFAHGHEVGGGEEADFGGCGVGEAVGVEYGGDEGAGAAFSFGSGDMEDVEGIEVAGLGNSV